MRALIGHTGFVGNNLDKDRFDDLYNSKNIEDIKGNHYQELLCAGIRAEKFLANQYPKQDLQAIKELIEILKQVECKKFVLISTIDVYKKPLGVDETSQIDTNGLHPYGANRYYMEQFVKEHYQDYLIVRLPALFGKGLKKNFIYDMIHKIPSMIMKAKYQELLELATEEQHQSINESYQVNEQGNYVLVEQLTDTKKSALKTTLETLGFTSLVFTDCRSRFPFYDLSNLQKDIDFAIEQGIKELNIAVEPITAQEVAEKCFGVAFDNRIEGREPVTYDMKSIHAQVFGGNNGYLYSKEQTIQAIKTLLKTV